jgi:hypothetical protein
MAESENQQAAVLTNGQREYLRGSRESEGPAARSMKSRIRARVSASITDYSLIVDSVDPDQVVNDVESGLVEGLKAQVRFVYKCASAAGLHPKELIDDAVEEAQQGRIEALKQKYENDPESMTLGEVSDLYTAGVIPEDEYEEIFRKTIAGPEPGMVSVDDLGDYLGDQGEK